MADSGLKREPGDWAEDFAWFAEYQRAGEYIDAEVAMAQFRQAVADRVIAKRPQSFVPFDG
jgi:hypothetical protein